MRRPHVGVECGQRWWAPRSWARHPSCDNLLRFRRLGTPAHGFAVGPLMVWWPISPAELALLRVEALLAEWDAMSKGESPTTRRIREVITR